jgi:hypothetical protein
LIFQKSIKIQQKSILPLPKTTSASVPAVVAEALRSGGSGTQGGLKMMSKGA